MQYRSTMRIGSGKGMLGRVLRATILPAGMILALGVSTAKAQLQVVHPNGGERYVAGQTMRIEWTELGGYEPVRISVWNLQTGEWKVIAPHVVSPQGVYDWQIPSPFHGDLYRIKVESVNDPSDAQLGRALFTIDQATKVAGVTDDQRVAVTRTVSVSPNPVSTQATVDWGNAGASGVTLYDMTTGAEVASFATVGATSQQIPTETLASGTYLVKVSFQDGSVSYEKLIVIR